MEDADLRDIEEDDNDLYDNSDVVFTEHEGSVFVVSVDPKYGKYAVSGGEDDKAFVWEIITGKVVFECTGYKDSVTCACFNADSTLVAVGDMAGNVKVWKLETKQVIWSFETSDLEWLMWHPVAPVLLAGTQDGESWMWKIPSGDLKTYHSPGSSCTCGVFLPDGKSASFGYADGSVKIIELKSGDIKCSTSKGKNSKQEGINHIACDKEGNVLMTASIDGTSKLISTSTGKISVTYRVTEEKSDEEGESSVECVGFSSSLPLAASASLNNKLTIWDLKSGQARHKCIHPAGVSVMKWNKAGTSIYTACLDGIGRLWNARSGELENTFVGHSDEIYDIALTTDDKCFLSASADGSVRVYCMED
uniref:Angio-associated migratory cell protein n=1 Tax=Ciona savignyi TaxID=51511 RepID=H2YSN0_CIOSA